MSDIKKRYDRSGPDLHAASKKAATDANAGIKASKVFLRDCDKVGIEPTTRQASKYRKQRGKAFLGVLIVVLFFCGSAMAETTFERNSDGEFCTTTCVGNYCTTSCN